MPALGLGMSQCFGGPQSLPSAAASWSAGSGVTADDGTNPNPNMATGWGISETTLLAGQADPLGGTGAVNILETVATAWHFRYANSACGMVAGPAIGRIWVKSLGGRNWELTDAHDAIPDCKVNANGTVLAAPAAPATLTIIPGVGVPGADWYQCALYSPSGWDSTGYFGMLISPLSGSTPSYAGDITKGLTVYLPEAIQHRAAEWVDTIAGYAMAQATDGSQPFVQKADGTSPGGNTFAGKAALWQPNDTAKPMSCATAGLLALISGMPSHTWIWRGGSLAAPAAAVPLFGITGVGTYAVGLDTARKPYATIGATTITAAAARDATDVFTAFVWNSATGQGALYTITTAGVVTEQCAPTAMTVGTVTPTALTFTERSSATMLRRLYSSALSTAQLARICSQLAA